MAIDLAKRSAWLLFPKGQEHGMVSQTPAPCRSLPAVENLTPAMAKDLMTFAGEQNKLKMYGTVPLRNR